MKKLNLLSAITVACSALISGLQAAPITYSFVNNAAFQSGYTLSGSITTDGTIGELSYGNFAGWSFTITETATSLVKLSDSSPLNAFSNRIVASATQLTLPNPTGSLEKRFLALLGAQGTLAWSRSPSIGSGASGDPAREEYGALDGNDIYWNNDAESLSLSSTADGSWIIAEASAAAVPEPSTYGLLFGGFTLAVVAMRRRTSKQA
jgi:hypothetical protein